MLAEVNANPFVLFGRAHVVALVITIVLPALLSVLVRKSGSRVLAWTICWSLAAVLVLNELVHYVISFRRDGLASFLQGSLPLHICDAAVYLTAFTLLKRKQLAYELMLFLGIAGTLQAIITPNISDGFPSYYFIRFFITHCGIVTGVLLLTWGFKMRPRLRGIFLTFVITNIYAIFVGLANWALGGGANYMFLCEPPEGQSPFFFAPWPWYLMVLQPISLGLFFLIYAPFAIADRLRTKTIPR